MKYALIVVVLLCGALSAAESAPAIVDEASFFSAGVVKDSVAILEKLSKETGQVVRVETYAKIPQELTTRFAEEGKDPFFQHWVLDRMNTTGASAFVLICKSPSHLRLALSPSLQGIGFDNNLRELIAQTLLNSFKAKQYDTGLMQLAARLDESIRLFSMNAKEPEPVKPAPIAIPAPVPALVPAPALVATQPESSHVWIWVLLGVLAFALIVFFIVSVSKKNEAENTDTPVDLDPLRREPVGQESQYEVRVAPPEAFRPRVVVEEPPMPGVIVIRRPAPPQVVIVEEEPPLAPIFAPMFVSEPEPEPTYSAPSPPEPDPTPAPSYTPDPDPPSSDPSPSFDTGSSGGDFGSSSDSSSSSSDSGSSGGDF